MHGAVRTAIRADPELPNLPRIPSGGGSGGGGGGGGGDTTGLQPFGGAPVTDFVPGPRSGGGSGGRGGGGRRRPRTRPTRPDDRTVTPPGTIDLSGLAPDEEEDEEGGAGEGVAFGDAPPLEEEEEGEAGGGASRAGMGPVAGPGRVVREFGELTRGERRTLSRETVGSVLLSGLIGAVLFGG